MKRVEMGTSEMGEHDARRIADRGGMAGKQEAAGFVVYAKHRHVVGSLVATIKKLAGRIEIKATRIVSTRPFLADKGQLPILADREYPNAIVQAVAGIDNAAIP